MKDPELRKQRKQDFANNITNMTRSIVVSSFLDINSILIMGLAPPKSCFLLSVVSTFLSPAVLSLVTLIPTQLILAICTHFMAKGILYVYVDLNMIHFCSKYFKLIEKR